MKPINEQIVLITGANSGVGFEAAAQFAEAGYRRVILACRTIAKAEQARELLRARTGKDVFDVLAIDTSEVISARKAVAELRQRGTVVDALVLNAGASGGDPKFNSDGIEITWASTLVGHHALTMGLLEHQLLGKHARIVIAGSEGARGNMPGMKLHDIAAIADEHFGGDRAAAIGALSRIQHQESFENMNEYVTAKLVVAWWAGGLSRLLPAGMTVNAVSPGSAPNSGFARNAGFGMKVMVAVMKVLGPFIGMAGSLETAARRYVDATARPDDDTGNFYATAHPSRAVGEVGLQSSFEHFLDRKEQDAAFEAIAKLTGVGYPSQPAVRAAV